MGEEVLDADGEVVVGVEEAGGAGDDAVAVVVGVGGEGDVVFVLVGDDGGHGEGGGAVHADCAVPVAGHEAEGGVDVGVEDFEGEFVLLGDAGPVVDAGAAEGVDGEFESGGGDGGEVDDVGEVVDVGGDVVVAVGGGGGEGAGVGDALDGRLVPARCGEEVVGAVLDPLGGGGVGGAAVGGVVFEAAVLGGVVGGGDDDAVGLGFAWVCGVVGEDGVGEGGGGGVGEVLVDEVVSMLLAARTSRAVAKAGSERAWVSWARKRGPVVPLLWRYSTMAWVMAAMWSSLKAVLKEEPRWPEVPKETRWAGMAGSGWSS